MGGWWWISGKVITWKIIASIYHIHEFRNKTHILPYIHKFNSFVDAVAYLSHTKLDALHDQQLHLIICHTVVQRAQQLVDDIGNAMKHSWRVQPWMEKVTFFTHDVDELIHHADLFLEQSMAWPGPLKQPPFTEHLAVIYMLSDELRTLVELKHLAQANWLQDSRMMKWWTMSHHDASR